ELRVGPLDVAAAGQGKRLELAQSDGARPSREARLCRVVREEGLAAVEKLRGGSDGRVLRFLRPIACARWLIRHFPESGCVRSPIIVPLPKIRRMSYPVLRLATEGIGSGRAAAAATRPKNKNHQGRRAR